jgi:hypothetical protein
MSLEQVLDVNVRFVSSKGVHGSSSKFKPGKENEKLFGKKMKVNFLCFLNSF